ncbi:alpha/beta-Hydrolase [Glarea lozoyensis ATCC 20868]|uniref:Alpha/beta-Hydrolase n=1 Tax=Glarea lozoyensis (strain ATCC 20868 / MF5171) TaxID=1116229 RepID=S3DCN7_GLAL2|nr:alpha/beta-Hydrolase [Glarea lozoyensis ATCC 20868]EPE29756.1 alpha/beta-Hydrolase [Glarea lozoyensis ATCC 20868]
MKASLLVIAGLALSVFGRRPIVCGEDAGVCQAVYRGLRNDKLKIEKYVGIPYAQPPVGKLRLQPPKPLAHMAAPPTVDASKPTSKQCYSLANLNSATASEDCLTLDLVMPVGTFDHLLPVYVFLHGGDFNGGDKSDVDGSELVSYAASINQPFIFISVNYRLSFLGFPGGSEAGKSNAYNLGLKDQRLALQWVKDNIKGFGGNKDHVVLGGQASGADTATYQMLANGGNNEYLFRGMLLESGAATGATPIPLPTYPHWQMNYDSLASKTNCSSASSFSCLQNVPIEKLTSAMYAVFTEAYSIPHHVYAVVSDGVFMQDYPSVAMAQSKFASLPTLTGQTTDELTDRIPTFANFTTDEGILGFAQVFLNYVDPAVLAEEVGMYKSSDYQDIGPPGSGTQWSRVVDIDNDLQAFCPVYQAALQISEKAAVWKYRFNARHSTSTTPAYLKINQGSDLPFLFGPTPLNPTTQEDILAESYKRYIISFINHLDPNKAVNSTMAPLSQWDNFRNSSQNQLLFDLAQINMEYDPVNRERCLWVEEHHKDFLR